MPKWLVWMPVRLRSFCWHWSHPCSYLWHRYETVQRGVQPGGTPGAEVVQCRYCSGSYPIVFAPTAYVGTCPALRHDGLRCDLPYGHGERHYNRYGGFPFDAATAEEVEEFRAKQRLVERLGGHNHPGL